MFAPPICRRSRRNDSRTELILQHVVSSDSTKTAAPQRTLQRAKRAIEQSERSERSNQIRARATEILSLPPRALAQPTIASASASGLESCGLSSATSDWIAVASEA